MKECFTIAIVGSDVSQARMLIAKLPLSFYPEIFETWTQFLFSLTDKRFDLIVPIPTPEPMDLSPLPQLPLLALTIEDWQRPPSELETKLLQAILQPPDPHPLQDMIGVSKAIADVRKKILKAAASMAPILFVGENGTGKDLAATLSHRLSSVQQGPFIAVNCGTIPPALADSQLFGSVRGAFTGAENSDGFCQQAAGGTLFLDEIGDLALETQVKLLRVLENHELRKVGSSQLEKVHFRPICATNCDLPEAVRGGRFREDLFYRINVLTIRLPSLRERLEDLPLLIQHFYQNWEQESGTRVRILPRAIGKLAEYPWPGNLRQLRNTLVRAAVLAGVHELDAHHFDLNDV